MSLSINVTNADVTIAPAVAAQTTTLDGEVLIRRIADLPGQSKVRVFVQGIDDPIDLDELSGDNYGSDWTYEQVKTALTNWIAANG